MPGPWRRRVTTCHRGRGAPCSGPAATGPPSVPAPVVLQLHGVPPATADRSPGRNVSQLRGQLPSAFRALQPKINVHRAVLPSVAPIMEVGTDTASVRDLRPEAGVPTDRSNVVAERLVCCSTGERRSGIRQSVSADPSSVVSLAPEHRPPVPPNMVAALVNFGPAAGARARPEGNRRLPDWESRVIGERRQPDPTPFDQLRLSPCSRVSSAFLKCVSATSISVDGTLGPNTRRMLNWNCAACSGLRPDSSLSAMFPPWPSRA